MPRPLSRCHLPSNRLALPVGLGLLLALAAAPLTASEPAEDDFENGIWIALQSLPLAFEIDNDRGPDIDDDFDSAGRLVVGYRGRTPGRTAFTIAGGLAFSGEDFDDIEIGGFGVVAEPGVSWRFHERFDLDLLGRVGLGVATIEDTASGIDEDGGYLEFGVLVRPRYRFHSGVDLFADLGLLGRGQAFTIDDGGDEYDLTVSSGGVTLGFGVGYRF